jgi:hypothetical protein
MNTYFSFVFAFIVASVCLIQFSFATNLEVACKDTNIPCVSTDDCCVGLKCFMPNPSIGLKGFCEKPLLAEKRIELKSTTGTDSTTTTATHLRQKL